MGTLTTPPKLAGLDNGEGPKTIGDWLSIYRFLISLWRKAQSSVTPPEVPAFTRPGILQRDTETLPFALNRQYGRGASVIEDALTFRQAQLPSPNTREVSDLVLARPQQLPTPQTDVFSFAISQVGPPYPTPPPSPSLAAYTNLVGPHSDRLSQGNGTVAANTLTRTTGPTFPQYWVGKRIGIGNNVYSILTWIDANNVTVNGTPPAGAVLWQMEYFAPEDYAVGRFLYETDRESLYYNGGTNGTGDLSHYVYTWVSGPFFSPYMVGLTIYINGIGYTVATATQGTITLQTDSGLVTAGLTWSVADSAWYYAAGRYNAGTSNKPADLNCYTDVGFEFYDENRLILYTAVRDLAFSTSLPYFAWSEGIETMAWATFGARTFRNADAGYLISISDYGHTIRWDGSNWAFAVGDGGSGWIVMYGPNVVGSLAFFVLCNGAAHNLFSINAGVPVIVNITTPDLTSNDFIRGGTYTGAIDAATSPTFSGTPGAVTGTFSGTAGAVTGTFAGSAGAVAGTFAGTPATLTGSVAAPVFTGNALATHQHAVSIGMNGTTFEITASYGTTSAGHSGANNVATAAGGGLFSDINTSNVSGGTPSGTNSAPALTMNSYTPAGTLSMSNFTPAGTLAINNFTPAGTIAINNFTPAGTVSAPVVGAGAPASMALAFYMRI